MPRNPVTDPITDQEAAFAHLLLSGTMNDTQAAESVGLKPSSAAYIKSKPRVRDYMVEHRNAVKGKLIDQEAEGLRALNLGRDQILARLWELARLSPEATRGSISGQIKAMSMIVAMEGLVPDRRLSSSHVQPDLASMRSRRTEAMEPREAVPAVEKQPAATKVPDPAPPQKTATVTPSYSRDHKQPGFNPFTNSKISNSIPDAIGAYDVNLNAAGSLRLAIPYRTEDLARAR